MDLALWPLDSQAESPRVWAITILRRISNPKPEGAKDRAHSPRGNSANVSNSPLALLGHPTEAKEDEMCVYLERDHQAWFKYPMLKFTITMNISFPVKQGFDPFRNAQKGMGHFP